MQLAHTCSRQCSNHVQKATHTHNLQEETAGGSMVVPAAFFHEIAEQGAGAGMDADFTNGQPLHGRGRKRGVVADFSRDVEASAEWLKFRVLCHVVNA